MNWTEQAESMMKTWTEAQKQLWGGWMELAQNAPGAPGMPGMSDPMGWMKQGMAAWTKAGGDTSQGVAGNIFGSQAMMMRSLEMLTKAWQTVAPKMEAGKAWQPDLQAFMKQWTDEVMGLPQRLSTAGTDMNELMKSFMGEWGPLLKPWLASVQGAGLTGHMGDMLMGGSSPLSKMLGMRMDMEPAFEDLSQIPTIGVSREQMAKVMRAFDSYVDLRKAAFTYHQAMAAAIGQAVEQTMEHLAGLAEKGEQITSVRELMRVWVKIADRKFTEMYNSEEFTEVQREMSKAGMQHKLANRAVLEMLLKQLDIPTRTEVDDAYKTLHGLKKEVRDLRNALKEAQGAKPGKASKKKTATKKATA